MSEQIFYPFPPHSDFLSIESFNFTYNIYVIRYNLSLHGIIHLKIVDFIIKTFKVLDLKTGNILNFEI